jgi:hypothetical protein
MNIIKFKISCPECGASVLITRPEAITWEWCSECRSHVWDMYDVLMAEVYVSEQQGVFAHAVALERNV